MDLQENAPYIESLLQRYGFRNIKPSHNGFIASCPFHEDRHPSFSISRTGLWMCWSCKAAGNIKKLSIVMGADERDWRESLKALGVQLRANSFERRPTRKRNTKDLPYDFIPYPCPETVPEAIAKRLSWNTIQHFGLGSSPHGPNERRCVIPITFKNATVGYHSRAIYPDMEPRYYNPSGFDIKEYVFNYDSCTLGGEVILVEGAFNAMSMWEKSYPNTMAVFGTQFTSGQLGMILSLNPDNIVICFDRDRSKIVEGIEKGKQGQRAAHKLGKLLHDAVPTFIMPLPVGQDPNELSSLVLKQCYHKRVPYEKVFGDN
jgi:DNA primase